MSILRSLGGRLLYGLTWLDAHILPRANGDMEILVLSNNDNYALEVDSSNTIWDVLIAVLGNIRSLGRWPKPTLWFNGWMLEEANSLSDYGIHDRCVLQLTHQLMNTPGPNRGPNEWECPSRMLGRRKIVMIRQHSVIWLKEYDGVLLDLMAVHTRNGGRHGGNFTRDSWRDIVAKFNRATRLNYEIEHLEHRLHYYRREYQIVNGIMDHRTFSWDHQRQLVITTDAEWNEYIKANPEAKLYRRRTVPYFRLLEIVCSR